VLKRVLAGLAVVVTVLASVAVGPGLTRRDALTYDWGGELGVGLLREPIGIAYRDARLYVSDAGNNRIIVFDTAGPVLEVWDASDPPLGRPMHLSWAGDGTLLVPEYINDRVSHIDAAGRVVKQTGGRTGPDLGAMDAPGGVAEAGGTLFVADFYNHRVDVLGGDGNRIIGRPGRVRAGRLHYPTDVATAGDTLVYVADAYNHRVQVFRTDGTFVRKWGGPLGLGGRGALRGWFRVATGIEVSDETVYVADFDNDRVQIFAAHGKYLGQVADSLLRPTDMVEGDRGELYVVDFGHNRIARFERRGSPS